MGFGIPATSFFWKELPWQIRSVRLCVRLALVGGKVYRWGLYGLPGMACGAHEAGAPREAWDLWIFMVDFNGWVGEEKSNFQDLWILYIYIHIINIYVYIHIHIYIYIYIYMDIYGYLWIFMVDLLKYWAFLSMCLGCFFFRIDFWRPGWKNGESPAKRGKP